MSDESSSDGTVEVLAPAQVDVHRTQAKLKHFDMELMNFREFKDAQITDQVKRTSTKRNNRFFDSFSQVLNII